MSAANEMELAQKVAEADAALGVAHEAVMQAQAAVLEPQAAVDLLVIAHEALDQADDAVEALAGLTGAPNASALRMDIRGDFQRVGLKAGKHAPVPKAPPPPPVVATKKADDDEDEDEPKKKAAKK